MSKQQPRTFDLSKYKTTPEVDSSDGEIKTFDLSNYSPKKKDDTELSGKISSTAGSSEQGGNPRQLFGMSYADWGKKYGAIGEFAADIVDVPVFFKNEIYKGVLNGAINDEIKRADGVGEKPDFDKIANLRKDINSVSLPKSVLDKIDESDDVVSKAVKSIGGTIVSSLASSIGAYKSGAVGATAGAFTGAAIGNVFAEVTAPVGAIAGYQAATSFANEYGSAVTDAMMAKGYDISDSKELEKAWNDKSVMDLAREKGTERGLTVAAIDLATAGLASKFGGKAAVKYAESKFLKEAGKEFTEAAAGRIAATTTTAIEAAGGSIGEATAQLVSEGKISDWDAVGMEAFAEVGGGAPMTAYNYFKAAQINSTANKENSTKIQSLQTMLESLPENDETIPIIQGKIADLKRDNEVRNNSVVETLDTAPVPVAKKVLELTNQIESFDQKLQEFDDASKVGSGLTDEQRQQQKTFKDIYTELTTERDNIVGELTKAREFESNINAPSPKQTMPSPVEVTKIQKAINTMTEFVGENLKAFAPTFAILPNGDYSLSVGKEGKPNAESTVIFNKEERQQRRELDSMLDEGTVTPEEHTNKVADLNKQIIARGIQEKTTLITPKEKVEVAPTATEKQPQTEEFVYETAPENKKQWKSDFEVVDNREGQVEPQAPNQEQSQEAIDAIAEVEKRRSEELKPLGKRLLYPLTNKPANEIKRDEINAKYDAELKALEGKTKANLPAAKPTGRWIVKNNVTGKSLIAATKSEAINIVNNAQEHDFGQGETYTRPVAVTPAAEPTVTTEPTTEQAAPTEINPENIMLSGLNGGYKSIAGNGFDIRSDISVMDKIDAGASFALNIIRNGKKYVVVGLRLKQDVGARTVGRDGYSIAVIEDTGNLPDNTVEVLTNKAVENTSSVYSRITDATIDSFRPLENEATISKSTTEQVTSTKKVSAPKGESADTIKSTALEVDEKGNEINNESNRKIKIIQSAKKALSTLRSVLPNFDIVIHQDEASYNEVMKEVNGREGSGGNFSYTENEDGSYSGKIDINLNKANSRTVAHEVAHGILLKTFGDNPAVFKDFKNKLSKILKDSTNKELINFTNQYEGDVAYEEYVTELTGILEQQQDNISPTTLQKVASLINTVVSKLTNGKISVFEDVKDTKELVEFMNTISASIREGKEINKANLKTIQESFGVNALGLSGEINVVDSAKSKSSITSAEIKRFPINENTKVQENIPLSDFEGKRVNLMESDRMVGGYIADAEGSPLFKFYGGVYYPMITGKWWASKSEVKARSIAENANKNRDADGYIYSAPMVGSNTQHMSNADMLAVTVELMKSDLNNKASIVKKQDIIDSLNKAFNRENVKNKKPALKNVLNKTNNITTLFNELEYVLFQENDNILDKNGKQVLGVDKKPISKFTFEERITIVQTLLGDPKVKQRRFPSAGSITETAKKFEEPITGKVENIGDMVTVMRTKGELKFAKTKIDDSFYHKSYPAEIYAVDKDGNPAEIEVFVLDGAYSMKEAVPTLSRSSGGEFTWEDYSSRHETEMLAIAQYNRTAKLSYAAGNIQPVKSKSQVSTQYNMDEMFDDPDKMFEHLDNQLSDQKTAKQMGFVLKGYRNISEAIADNMITRSLAKAVGSGFIGITKIGNFSFVNINTKDKDGNLVPNKVSLNSVWKDAFGYGENAIRSMFVKAHNSNNVAAKEVQNTLGSFITNLTTTEGFQEARRELFGSKNNSNNLLTRIGDSLNNMIGNDKKALYRVHSLLDPEAFANEPKEGRPESVEDLSFSELRLFNTLRATNDFIHEWHYRNGFLDENTYQKNKGKYFARAYKEIEEKQYADIYDAINKAKAGAEFDIFKKRKDFSEIEDLTLSDPIYITIKRMGTMAHNKAIFDFAQKVANDANYKSYNKLSEVPEKNQKYYKKLNGNGNPKRFGDLTNKYVPIEIYEQLYGTQFASQYMSTINDFATKYDNMFLRQLTKKLKTVGSPLTRAANVISGFSFAMLGGVDPINLLVKKPDARRSLDSYDSWAQELTKAGLLGGQLSGLDIKKAGKESQGLGVIKSVLGDKAAKAYETVDQLASDTYGKVDDITKIAYYRTLVENYGVSKEEAIKATAKQMQNYNTVTNAFKLAAKLPFIGNAFIKFKPDSMRILYNTFKEKPIFGLMFVAMLTGLSKSFSKLSGESDEEREIRENRPNTTKLKIGNLVDVNFGWKIGDTEYNVARYLSPYTMYDKGYRNNLVSDMSEYGPLQVQYLGRGRGLAGYAPKFSDPLLGPLVQAFLTDMDNSGLKISDPRANNFVGQTLSPKQQWFNRVKYVGRSWGTPYAAWAGNMMDSFNEKQNYKGEVNDPLNAMLSIAVKNEKINPDILTEKYGKYLSSMDREVGGIVNDWKSKQKKSLEQIDKIRYDFDNGKIKEIENRDKQIKDIEDEYSDLAIYLQGQMLEIVGDAKDPQEMLIKLQKLKAKKK